MLTHSAPHKINGYVVTISWCFALVPVTPACRHR